MSFFKVDKDLDKEDRLDPFKITKPKYVIDKDGKGYWIKPIPPLPTDFDEDVIY